MQDALGPVLFAVVGLAVVAAILSLRGRGRAYDAIGRGGLWRDDDLHRPEDEAARQTEIRELLEARDRRRARRGQPASDAGAELGATADPGLVDELRDLVVAGNRRRVRQGRPPLHVGAEVTRRLAELG